MDTRVCAGFALAASYWRDDDEHVDTSPEYEQEQQAVRAALAARCTGPHRLPLRQRR